MAAKTAENDVNSFFQAQMTQMMSGGLIIPECPFDVLCSLKEGKFVDAGKESLGEEMPMIILDYQQRWGITPWAAAQAESDGVEVKPEQYGEVWFLPVGGKIGNNAENKMVCRMLKPMSQLRLLIQAVNLCWAKGLHHRQVIWLPKFESASNKYGSYYKIKFTYRQPEGKELDRLADVVQLLKVDPQLEQLRDETMPELLYLKDMTREEKKALIAGLPVVQQQLPANNAVAALPAQAQVVDPDDIVF